MCGRLAMDNSTNELLEHIVNAHGLSALKNWQDHWPPNHNVALLKMCRSRLSGTAAEGSRRSGGEWSPPTRKSSAISRSSTRGSKLSQQTFSIPKAVVGSDVALGRTQLRDNGRVQGDANLISMTTQSPACTSAGARLRRRRSHGLCATGQCPKHFDSSWSPFGPDIAETTHRRVPIRARDRTSRPLTVHLSS